MAMTGTLKTTISITNSLDGIDLSTPVESVNEQLQKAIASGKMFHEKKALTASQNYSIDVSDGSLSDVFGNSIFLVQVEGIYVFCPTTNTGTVTVTSGANSFLETLPALSAGEGFSYLSDINVTTNGKLYFVDGGGADSFEVIIVGTE